ncbi:lycopene cyclase family protein [Algoriphagus namhaensis]|uniref:Lycopene cyclase family protein n=1 Tax=Algoriphagus namhaensis TaxID=915353 RepID=A0ABV8AM17_9BACT
MENSYDYIIAGSGLAGLSLLHRILLEGSLSEKKILVIDSDQKTKNDRTWCFWEKGKGLFEPIVHHTWDTLSFFAPGISETFQMESYSYKMILGEDFYSYVLEAAAKKANVKFLTTKIQKIRSAGNLAYIDTAEGSFEAQYVFNSTGLFFPKMDEENTLLQHFLGWKIKAKESVFDPKKATLMDFTLDQKHGTTFMYVLPTNPQEALVEYTLFTERVLEREEYEQALKKYIQEDLGIKEYEITHDEFGVIPMSLAKFKRFEGKEKRIINLGTAGGYTKASTGYTFAFVQKHLEKVVANLRQGKSPAVPKSLSDRTYDWYDRTLLDVLLSKKLTGREIFSQLFTKVPPESVMAFLANESSQIEEFKIRHSVPILAFATSGIRQILQ